MRKIILSAAVLISCFACNSSSDTNEEVTEVEEATAILPVMPEIKEGQSVFFPNLEDGQEITLPLVVEFGVNNMEVEPAGQINEDKGHHHLIIDGGALEAGVTVPADEQNFHFGKGQLSDTLQISKYPTLTPGNHTLTLQFADGAHSSYGPAMSKTINVVVK